MSDEWAITVYIRIGQSHCVSRVNQKKLYTPGLCKANNNKNHLGKPQSLRCWPTCKTLLILNLPHPRTHYSSWTCPIVEHPIHHGPTPPRNTLLTVDPAQMEHPTHRGPAPPRNPLLTLYLPHMKHPTHSRKKTFETNCKR